MQRNYHIFKTFFRESLKTFGLSLGNEWIWICHSTNSGFTKTIFYFPKHLLPPANEVWGKVIFLHQFVILFTGGMHGCPRGVCVVAPGGLHGFIWGACMVLFGGHAWFYSGGMHGFIQGGMHGFIWGHAWFYSGGMYRFIQGACMVALGGVHGCSGGACMVAPGGHAWLLQGGLRGFIQRGVHGFIWGHAWFYLGVCAWFYSGGHVWFYSGVCMVLFRGHAWFYSGGHAWFFQFFRIQWDTVNEWAVHILLECILVLSVFGKMSKIIGWLQFWCWCLP